MTHDLPPYSVRVSTRARRVRLTVTARHGLVVVVPRGYKGDPGALVASHAEWARRALASIAEKRAHHAAGPDALLPTVVRLGLTGETLAVEFRAGEGASRARRVGGALVVYGPADAETRLGALRRWLDREARALLLARFDELCARVGAEHAGVRVRATRSRWGSCSARRTVSLSRNLVFLAPELVDSVMLHEIAHFSALDHSPRFYRVLEGLDPGWRVHRARLKGADASVPAWADA